MKSKNILTLEERVRAIKEYDRVPVYRQVAEIMNCCQDQIINIIKNRQSILLYYASKTGDCQGSFTKTEDRVQKIVLLNEIMFEWVLRMQCRGNSSQITANLVRAVALDVKTQINIPNFRPNSDWFRSFMRQHNMTEGDLRKEREKRGCTKFKGHCALRTSDIVEYVKGLRDNAKQSKHQTLSGSRQYHIAHSQSKCGEVVEDVGLGGEGAYSPRTSQEVREIVDDAVPLKVAKVVDDVDHQPDPAKRYKKTYSRSKCRNVVAGIVPIEGPSTSQKSMAKVVDVSDDNDPVTCEEVVDDDVPVIFEKVVEGNETVDCDDVDVKKDDTHEEEEYVPRKVKCLERHDSRDTEKFIKSEEEALRYLKALENFVLLQANFRAIGVISQLEAVFRNPDMSK